MRLIFGFAAIGLLAGAYLVCPDALRREVQQTITPNDQVLAQVRDGIDTLMRHLDGPGDLNPDAPV
jgi:hypothetical protein